MTCARPVQVCPLSGKCLWFCSLDVRRYMGSSGTTILCWEVDLSTQNGRKEGIPVRVAHKSHTLRRALSHNNKERTCTRANCPISDTRLCLLRNAVYQITCKNCNQHYIGSTTRFIHDRVREHLNNDNSSVKKHLSKCQNKVHKGIEIKSIVLENDPANLRLFEAFYIRNHKPTINSREECSEFADLLF